MTRCVYEKGDDWNHFDTAIAGETIDCDNCKSNYHLEYVDFQKKIAYLVPNGCTLKIKTEAKRLPYESFVGFVNRAVALFKKEQLMEVVEDMKTNKFSTRLSLEQSRKIVEIYYRDKKSKKLSTITSVLEKCIKKYDEFEWNYDKVRAFRKEESEIIRKNKAERNKILLQSHKLSFRREE